MRQTHVIAASAGRRWFNHGGRTAGKRKGGGRREEGEGRREKGEARREKGEAIA